MSEQQGIPAPKRPTMNLDIAIVMRVRHAHARITDMTLLLKDLVDNWERYQTDPVWISQYATEFSKSLDELYLTDEDWRHEINTLLLAISAKSDTISDLNADNSMEYDPRALNSDYEPDTDLLVVGVPPQLTCDLESLPHAESPQQQHETALRYLGAISTLQHHMDTAEKLQSEIAVAAHKSGVSWAEIGRMFGVTGTAARRRFDPEARERHRANNRSTPSVQDLDSQQAS